MADEEKPTEEPVVEPPKEVTEESTDSSDLISRATDAAERLEEGNKQLEKNLASLQKLHVENTLSGKTSAGIPTQSKEDKEIAEAKKLLKGTGMEDYAFPEEKAK